MENQQIFEVVLHGLKPGVLMNRYNPENQMGDPTKQNKNSFDISEWEDKIYVDENDEVYLPAIWFERAITKIASNWKIPGGGRTSYKRWAQSSMMIMPDEIPVEGVSYGDFKKAEDKEQVSMGNQLRRKYENAGLYIARVKIGSSSIVRVRPFIYPWSITLKVYGRTQIAEADPELLAEMFNHAGTYPGVGDYRPQNNGKFGRFEVESVREIEGDENA